MRRPPPGSAIPPELAALAEREVQVLTMAARGMSNLDIAQSLFLSEATVKSHINRIFAKLGIRGRVQVVVLAYETGLVPPGEPVLANMVWAGDEAQIPLAPARLVRI